jgi:hypothetical protein
MTIITRGSKNRRTPDERKTPHYTFVQDRFKAPAAVVLPFVPSPETRAPPTGTDPKGIFQPRRKYRTRRSLQLRASQERRNQLFSGRREGARGEATVDEEGKEFRFLIAGDETHPCIIIFIH